MHNSLGRVIDGWFAVAYSGDVAAGAVRVVHYMGRPVALFRTQSGRIAATDAYCPHLGASFATMGRVAGEALVCKAHGFHFDGRGACINAYGRAAQNVRLASFHVREELGAIFVWYHHQGAEPSWELPVFDEPGWGVPLRKTWQLATHPQEVIENAVDVGHFEGVHGLTEAAPGSMQTDGPHLITNGTFRSRAVGPFERLCVTVSFRFDAFGLGFACSEAHLPGLGLRVRAFAAPTPRQDGTSDVRCWTQVYDAPATIARLPWLGRVMPDALARSLLGHTWNAVFSQDFAKDIVYWTTKRYLSPPSLARLDPYIGPYRKWAAQFYPAPSEQRVAAPAASAESS